MADLVDAGAVWYKPGSGGGKFMSYSPKVDIKAGSVVFFFKNKGKEEGDKRPDLQARIRADEGDGAYVEQR